MTDFFNDIHGARLSEIILSIFYYFVLPTAALNATSRFLFNLVEDRKFGFLQIEPQAFYTLIYRQVNIIIRILFIAINLVISPIFCIFLFHALTHDIALIVIYGYILWETITFAIYYPKKYINSIIFCVFVMPFRPKKAENYEGEFVTIALYGQRYADHLILLQKNVRDLSNDDIRKMSYYGLRGILFGDNIYERLYALKNHFSENKDLEASQVETSTFLKKANLMPSLLEKMFSGYIKETFLRDFIFFSIMTYTFIKFLY